MRRNSCGSRQVGVMELDGKSGFPRNTAKARALLGAGEAQIEHRRNAQTCALDGDARHLRLAAVRRWGACFDTRNGVPLTLPCALRRMGPSLFRNGRGERWRGICYRAA
jgi:hypothetical protein